MKHFSNILVLFLAILLCASSLFWMAGCGSKPSETAGPESDDPETTAPPAPPLTLCDENGKNLYQIIRSDVAGSAIVTASASISRALKTLFGNAPVIGTDWVDRNGKADHPETDYEILIGKTNRQESLDLYAELSRKPNEPLFVIRVVGTKILLGATNEFSLERCISCFVSEYLTGEQAGMIPSDLNLTVLVDALYVMQLDPGKGDVYDLSVAAATLQGLFNREAPASRMYLTNQTNSVPSNILKLTRSEDGWLSTFNQVSISSLQDWIALGSAYIKTIVIWDPAVPATLNVATTIAGVEDGIVLTEAQYDALKEVLPSDAKTTSLVGRFDGSETGSAKNDAYRWAIREYLATGKCTTARICSYEDSFLPRSANDVAYTVPRDLAVYDRAFVFDLSVWRDERPKDDPKQAVGTDFSTFILLLETLSQVRGMDRLTEIDGFFASHKYASNGNDDTFHANRDGTQTEWEYTYQFTPYGCYWNSVAAHSYNMSLHCQYELRTELKQQDVPELTLNDSPNVLYLLLCAGDYDSSGSVYNRMYANWQNESRGNLPLAWSINPNLVELYPDLFEYFYSTATENDFFVSCAGSAGWYNPSRVKSDTWDAVLAHHKYYFELTDMSISPDIWDFQTLSKLSESYITQYATNGVGMLVSRQNGRGTGAKTVPHVSDSGVPINAICNIFPRDDAAECGRKWAEASADYARNGHATFMSVRTVWVTPAYLEDCVEEFRKNMPDTEIVVIDPYNFYAFLKASLGQ